jgi:hypothetical protein
METLQILDEIVAELLARKEHVLIRQQRAEAAGDMIAARVYDNFGLGVQQSLLIVKQKISYLEAKSRLRSSEYLAEDAA